MPKQPLGVTFNVPSGQEATGVYEAESGIEAFETDAPYLLSDGVSLQPLLPVVLAGGPTFIDSMGNVQAALAVSGIGPGPDPDPEYGLVFDAIGMVFDGERMVFNSAPEPARPGTISDLSVLSTTTSTIALAFTDAARATSHQYRLDGGPWAALAGDKIIVGLEPDTVYDVQVRGVNDEDAGPPSNSVEATTESIPVPVPENTSAPTISGTEQVEEVLTADPGEWTNDPTGFTYQWQRNDGSWVDIAGATSSTYLLTLADEGLTIRVRVIAVKDGGDSVPAFSDATGEIQPDIPVGFDYTIASDSDWDAIPSELLTGGGTVGIEPGVYSSRTLQGIRPSAPLVFQAIDPDDMPVLMRFTGYDLWNVEFHDVDRVSDAWGPNPAPAWAWSASNGKGNGNIRFVGGRVRGNWRGDIDFPFDPTADYPEYANIVPQFDQSGQVASLEVRNAYVGTNTPDGQLNGTYTLDFTAGANANNIYFVDGTYVVGGVPYVITGASKPNITFTVTDGYIQPNGFTIISAGVAKKRDNSPVLGSEMNNNWGILSKIIVWDGQIRLFDVMAQGERVITPSGGNARDVFTGPMEWRDVEWSLLVGGSRGSIADTGSIHFIGNHFDLIYGDSIAYGASANATSAPGVTIEYNTFTRPFSSPRDPSDPHSDPIQLWFAVNDNAFDWPVLVRGNVVWIGEARGTVQGVFIADPPVSGDFGYTGYIYGNLILNADLPNGMSLEQGRDMYIADNTVVRYSPGDPVNGSNTVITGLGRSGSKVLGHSFFGSNISEGFTTGTNIIDDGTVESAGFSNVVLGRAGLSIPYTDVFTDPSGERDTFQQVLAAYTPKVGYANKGAVGRYIDFTNRTADLAQQVVFVGLPDIVGQEPNTSVTSGWKKIIGGAESGPISITGGEYQFADDINGSNATTPTSDPGVYLRDKFIQVVQTTSSGESITTTATVSLNGYLNAFNATTKSNAEYPVVAFDGADRFKRNGVLGTDGRYLTLAFKMKFPSDPPASNLPIFTGLNPSEGAGVGAVQMLILPTGALRFAILNAAGGSICQLNSTGGSWCDGQVHEVLIDIDTEQAVAGDGRALWIDGVNRLSATGAWSGGPGIVAGYSRSVGISGYAIGGGSALMLPAGVEMDYIYLNIDERAGVNDSAVRAKFDATNIGPDGSGVTGNQPHTFVTGTAAQWNDPAGINWGSDGKYIAASGSAVTDVSGDPWP